METPSDRTCTQPAHEESRRGLKNPITNVGHMDQNHGNPVLLAEEYCDE